ncbi:hypothetical protein O181_025833 [Austropuccinia psidii MF-1]|uniref:CCHC-type domain-containing protein n=1 Tax=Austropuccinia psidii MF-1 TaxID=1389203 RepID=A0A9Q3CNN2_9BASI|nr:hypothetical protein [Austropuccinia psidii MF-1]
MSGTMIHKSILRKYSVDLEHPIRSRCIQPFSKEDYIDAMEDITTREKIERNWYKPPIDNKTSGKTIAKLNKPHDKAPLKCHKCGSTSHLDNPCPKKQESMRYKLKQRMTQKKPMMYLYMKVILSLLKKED